MQKLLWLILNSKDLRDVIQESGQRLEGVVAEMSKFRHELFLQSLIDDLDSDVSRFVGKEISVICRLQMQLQIWNRMINEQLTSKQRVQNSKINKNVQK